MMCMVFRRMVAATLVLLMIVAAAPAAVAAEAAEDPAGTPPLLQFDTGSAIVNIAIFLIVFVILSTLVWPVILRGLEMRDNRIRDDLEGAHLANQQARQLLAQYEAQLADASSQVQKMLSEAYQASEEERQRIVAEARSESEVARQRALADIEQAKKVAVSELAGATTDMALKLARGIIGRELQPEDHTDLIRQSLDRLPSNN